MKEIECKICSDKKLVKSKLKLELDIFGIIGDNPKERGSGFWIYHCPSCSIRKINEMVLNDLDNLNIYSKEPKMNEKYNLSWEEAKLAMERGAVIGKHAIKRTSGEVEDIFQCKVINNKINVKPFVNDFWTEIDEMEEQKNTKWRIVELTNCEIGSEQTLCSLPPMFEKRCQKHNCVVREDFYSELSRKLKDRCIQKFTEQLKKDVEDKNKTPGFQFEEGKFYKSKLNGNIYRIKQEMVEIFSYVSNACAHRVGPHLAFQWFNHKEKKWDKSLPPGQEMINAKFIEIEDPEKKEHEKSYNELGMKPVHYSPNYTVPACLNFDICGENVQIDFQSRERFEKFIKAWATFMRLKSHPLAVKANFNAWQFAIHYDLGDIKTHTWHGEMKLSFISPMFSTVTDTKQAIHDIGEENLKQMFLTFQGVYSEAI